MDGVILTRSFIMGDLGFPTLVLNAKEISWKCQLLIHFRNVILLIDLEASAKVIWWDISHWMACFAPTLASRSASSFWGISACPRKNGCQLCNCSVAQIRLVVFL